MVAGAGPTNVRGSPEDTSGLAQVRLELAEAIRSRNSAQTRLKAAEEELVRLRARAAADARIIREATSDRQVLTTKLKDREHELREKGKLVEVWSAGLTLAPFLTLYIFWGIFINMQAGIFRLGLLTVYQNVQDEMITLNLQLSMVEVERDKIKKENKDIKKENQDLVDRLMKWKANEADAMNRVNEPLAKKN